MTWRNNNDYKFIVITRSYGNNGSNFSQHIDILFSQSKVDISILFIYSLMLIIGSFWIVFNIQAIGNMHDLDWPFLSIFNSNHVIIKHFFQQSICKVGQGISRSNRKLIIPSWGSPAGSVGSVSGCVPMRCQFESTHRTEHFRLSPPPTALWLGNQRSWYVQPCLCDWAYKRSHATYRKEKGIVSRWFLVSFIN